jgi:hypothetical protein
LFFFPKFRGAGGAFLSGGMGKALRPSSGLGDGPVMFTAGAVWLLDIGVFGIGIFGGGPLGASEGRVLDGGSAALYGTLFSTSLAFLCCCRASNPVDGASGLYCWKACCVGDGILCSASTMLESAGAST